MGAPKFPKHGGNLIFKLKLTMLPKVSRQVVIIFLHKKISEDISLLWSDFLMASLTLKKILKRSMLPRRVNKSSRLLLS